MEASSCPKVVVADIDTKSFQHKQTVHVRQVRNNSCLDPEEGTGGPDPSEKSQKYRVV